MDDDGGDARRWQEPPAGPTAVLLRSGGLGLCFVLAATSAVSSSWDGAVVAAVIAVALALDLWRDLRPRQFMVAGPDLLIVGTPPTATAVPWSDIARVGRRRRRLRPARPVLVRRDGTTVDLPRRVPVEDVERWLFDHGDHGDHGDR